MIDYTEKKDVEYPELQRSDHRCLWWVSLSSINPGSRMIYCEKAWLSISAQSYAFASCWSGVNLPLDLVVRLPNPTMDWIMTGGRLGPSYYCYLQCPVSSQIDPNLVLTTVWFGGSHQERLKAGAKLDNIYYLLIIS